MYSGGSLKSVVFEHLGTTSYGISTRPSEVRATFWGDQDCDLLAHDDLYFSRGALNTLCHLTCMRSSNNSMYISEVGPGVA